MLPLMLALFNFTIIPALIGLVAKLDDHETKSG
jgi:hypothetical protein